MDRYRARIGGRQTACPRSGHRCWWSAAGSAASPRRSPPPRAGPDVVLTEETDWLGGQLTSQAVPPDEHPWIEQFGATAQLPAAARRHPRLLPAPLPADRRRRAPAAAQPRRRPGQHAVPRAARRARRPRGACSRRTAPPGGCACSLEHGRVDVARATATASRPSRCATRRPATSAWSRAAYVLDATETGELLPLAGAEYVTGAESRGRAPASRTRRDAAAAAEHAGVHRAASPSTTVDGEDHTIDRPARLRVLARLPRRAFWPGPLLGLLRAGPAHTRARCRARSTPNPPGDPPASRPTSGKPGGNRELWLFRRILARGIFEPRRVASDITLVNWPHERLLAAARSSSVPPRRPPATRGAPGS